MLKHAAAAVCIAGLVACASGQSGPTDPSTEVETEAPDPVQSEVEQTPVEPAEPDPVEPEPEPEPAESKAPEPTPKKECAPLGQKICEVTMGCLWHTQKKCIEGQPE